MSENKQISFGKLARDATDIFLNRPGYKNIQPDGSFSSMAMTLARASLTALIQNGITDSSPQIANLLSESGISDSKIGRGFINLQLRLMIAIQDEDPKSTSRQSARQYIYPQISHVGSC